MNIFIIYWLYTTIQSWRPSFLLKGNQLWSENSTLTGPLSSTNIPWSMKMMKPVPLPWMCLGFEWHHHLGLQGTIHSLKWALVHNMTKGCPLLCRFRQRWSFTKSIFTFIGLIFEYYLYFDHRCLFIISLMKHLLLILPLKGKVWNSGHKLI